MLLLHLADGLDVAEAAAALDMPVGLVAFRTKVLLEILARVPKDSSNYEGREVRHGGSSFRLA